MALLIIVPLLVGLLSLYLGQDSNWDFRNYHWYNAYAFLNDRYGFDILPSQTPYFYNPTLDVPFYLLAQNVSAKTAGFILGTVQGINFILLFLLCHATLRIPNAKQKVWVCALLSALGLLGGGGLAQIGTSFYDNITSLGLFTSALLVIHTFERLITAPWKKAFALALLCGFPAGLMMGLKLPFVVFCVGLCAALLFVTGPFKRRLLITFGFGVGVLVGLVLTNGQWAAYLYTTYQNPVFPYFNGIFHSPFGPQDSGRDMKFLPATLFDRVFFPFVFTASPYRTGEIPWRDLRIPILYGLVPLCVALRLIFGRNKNAPDRLTSFFAARYLLWAAALSYLVWLFLFAIYRYIIPLEMIAPLLIVVTLGLLPVRPQIRAILTAFILIIIAATIQPGDWGRKKPWLDRAVEVTHPKGITYADDLMILMAGYEPYSHVVTEFPPHIPFVRIQSNFASPDQKEKGINQTIRDRVLGHKGSYKLLIPKGQTWHAEQGLKLFDLTFLPQSCQAVEDHLFNSELELCDVQPIKKSGAP